METKNNYGIIYQAINKINNKKYIGQTITTLTIRKRQHKSDSKRDFNCYFHNAINKYGIKNFEWNIIDRAESQSELDEKEIFWIKFLKTYKEDKGYNMTLGGQANKIYDYSEYTDYISERKKQKYNYDRNILVFDLNGNKVTTCTLNNIEDIIHSSTYIFIMNVLKGIKPSINNYFLFYEDEFSEDKLKDRMQRKRFKPFTLFNAKTKECIGIWNNILQCEKEQSLASRRGMQLQLNTIQKQHPRKYICKFVDNLDEELKESLNTYLELNNKVI